MTAIEAGRELDALVAEKVMGWVRVPTEPGWHIPEMLVPNPEYGSRPLESRRPSFEAQALVPHYSTDIAAAWTVVEKLHLWVFPQDGRWYAGVEGSGADYVYVDPLIGVLDGHLAVLEQADTAPLAICRAALAAVSRPVTESDAPSPASQD